MSEKTQTIWTIFSHEYLMLYYFLLYDYKANIFPYYWETIRSLDYSRDLIFHFWGGVCYKAAVKKNCLNSNSAYFLCVHEDGLAKLCTAKT